MDVSAIISVVLAYLIGSISFSYLMAKWVKGVDIRDHGSGNAGATNTLRLLGKGPAVTVLLLDALKGVLAVWLTYFLVGNNPAVLALSGMLAIFGHNWPVFLRFRGGKGVATTIGVVISLVFYAGLISGIIAILLIVITRFVSLGSLVFTVGLPFTVLAFQDYYPAPYLWLSIVIAVLAIVRHKRNIKSLFQGTERKIGQTEGERQ
jgi:glycerol-3-phosphate acyltransferase PlsY